MAYGKSLEMKAIKIPPGQPLCICRLPWPDHMTKDKKRRLKKYDNEDHYLAGQTMDQRALTEAMEHGKTK